MEPEGAVLAREVFVGRRARVNCFWDSFGVWIGVALFGGRGECACTQLSPPPHFPCMRLSCASVFGYDDA